MGLLRADTGNFNRLLVSLGLILLALALIAPWALMREDHALTFTRVELARLTPRAAAILHERQERVGQLQDAAPWACVTLIVGGVVLLLIGARGMKSLAPLEEREMRARVRQAEASIAPMTPEEQAHKAQEDVRETQRALAEEIATSAELSAESDAAAEAMPAEKSPTAGSGEPEVKQEPEPDAQQEPETVPTATSAGTAAPPPPPESDVSVQRKLAQAPTYEWFLQTERRVLELLDHSVPDGYEFHPQVRVEGGDARLFLDGLFLSANRDRRDVIVEIKVSTTAGALRHQARLATNQLLASGLRYASEIGKRLPSVWLIAVVDTQPPARVTHEIEQLLAPLSGVVSVIERASFSDLKELPWPPGLGDL